MLPSHEDISRCKYEILWFNCTKMVAAHVKRVMMRVKILKNNGF